MSLGRQHAISPARRNGNIRKNETRLNVPINSVSIHYGIRWADMKLEVDLVRQLLLHVEDMRRVLYLISTTFK